MTVRSNNMATFLSNMFHPDGKGGMALVLPASLGCFGGTATQQAAQYVWISLGTCPQVVAWRWQLLRNGAARPLIHTGWFETHLSILQL